MSHEPYPFPLYTTFKTYDCPDDLESTDYGKAVNILFDGAVIHAGGTAVVSNFIYPTPTTPSAVSENLFGKI